MQKECCFGTPAYQKVEGWFMIMKNVPQNKKLTLFLDYYVQQ
jgi:hypothetical protein